MGMWRLTCALLLAAPALTLGQAADQEEDELLSSDGPDGSWAPEPEPMVGYECGAVFGHRSCQEVYAPDGPAAFENLTACEHSGCPTPRPSPSPGPHPGPYRPDPKDIVKHPKDHVPEIIVAVVAVLALLLGACFAVKKCKKGDGGDLEKALNAPLDKKDALDDPSVSSW
jgi:hypothetical protein